MISLYPWAEMVNRTICKLFARKATCNNRIQFQIKNVKMLVLLSPCKGDWTRCDDFYIFSAFRVERQWLNVCSCSMCSWDISCGRTGTLKHQTLNDILVSGKSLERQPIHLSNASAMQQILVLRTAFRKARVKKIFKKLFLSAF